MRHVVVAIFDQKAELFSKPFEFQAVGQAVRQFSDMVNDGKSEFAKHPDDYTLFRLGYFDDVKGELQPEVPVSLGNGLMFVVRGDPNQLKLEA